MFKKIFGELSAAILFLIIGIGILAFSLFYQPHIALKIIGTLMGTLLTIINAVNIIMICFYDGKDESAKSPITFLPKNANLNVEKLSTPFTLCGLALATGLMFMAFSWNGTEKKPIRGGIEIPGEDYPEVVPPTKHPTPPPPPLPPPPPPPPPIKIEEVDYNINVDDQPVLKDQTLEEEDDIIDIPDPDKVLEGLQEEIAEEIPEEIPEEPDFFTIVEEMPSFKGGEKALFQYLSNQIKYPSFANQNGIDGTVFLSFVVKKDGTIRDIEVVRSPHSVLSEEALRVVKQMPPWNPGLQRGKPVNVKFTIPIKFVLN